MQKEAKEAQRDKKKRSTEPADLSRKMSNLMFPHGNLVQNYAKSSTQTKNYL